MNLHGDLMETLEEKLEELGVLFIAGNPPGEGDARSSFYDATEILKGIESIFLEIITKHD